MTRWSIFEVLHIVRWIISYKLFYFSLIFCLSEGYQILKKEDQDSALLHNNFINISLRISIPYMNFLIQEKTSTSLI